MFYGVTFHPYHSLWEIRRHPVLLPALVSPLVTLSVVVILGKIGSLLILVYGRERTLIAIVLGGAMLSIVLWQILLVYFLLTFLYVSRHD